MEENSGFDKKSIKIIQTKNVNWDELAKDCVAFANSAGGVIHIGIEDAEELPHPSQKIKLEWLEKINKTIPQRTIGVAVSASKVTADNGGQYIQLTVFRNSQSIASTSDGKYYIRIAPELSEKRVKRQVDEMIEKQIIVAKGEKRGRKYQLDNHQ
ncbi:MAG: helix-turn-helix domain-containing protein [Cyclobacteriaceae bacterium]